MWGPGPLRKAPDGVGSVRPPSVGVSRPGGAGHYLWPGDSGAVL